MWLDTTGWAFTFPAAKAAGARVACYVHYPTVSTDMLGRCATPPLPPPLRARAPRFTPAARRGPRRRRRRRRRRAAPRSVRARAAGYDNAAAISGSGLRSGAKVAYYRLFALAYGLCGAFAGAPPPPPPLPPPPLQRRA